MKKNLTIATRQSQLALWQAAWVKKQLELHHTDLHIKLLPLITKGDQILDVSLVKIGGKGLFVKALEHALLDGRADIAVHSTKDLPMDFPNGLSLPVICKRHDPCDALLSTQHKTIESLPNHAVVGTSSLRRQSQLLHKNPAIHVKDLRGNINTRLEKLMKNEFDAIILAKAGIDRLGIGTDIATPLSLNDFLPAAGQGALSIECRTDDIETQKLIHILHDTPSALCIAAERAMVRFLQGNCQVPIGAYASIYQDTLSLQGFVGDAQGTMIIKKQSESRSQNSEKLGIAVAQQLLSAGADKILEKYR